MNPKASDNPQRSTLGALDTAMRWQPGSARAVLDGGEPTPLVEDDTGDRMLVERRVLRQLARSLSDVSGEIERLLGSDE